MYTMDQVQDMLTQVHNDPKIKTAILKCFAHDHADQNAVADVISDGWVERFDRYDSAVCDDFIRAWEKCTKKKLKESSNMKNYELEMEFRISFNKKLSFGELQSIVYFLNAYFGGKRKIAGDLVGLNTCSGLPGHPVIEPNDVDFDKQTIYLLLYYNFEGHIEWDQDGIGQDFYEFEGAPDPEDDELFYRSIKNIVCATPEVELRPSLVNVVGEGRTLKDLLDDIVEHEAIGEYEAKCVIGKLLEGANVRKLLL